MSIIGVFKAQFTFSANSPQELSISEGDLLYLFDKGDDGWWTCKKRIPGAANEEPTGLVPHNFVAPAQPEGSATALYNYDAQTTEELSFVEAATFDVFAQDGDWVLVGTGGKFGFVPANYIQTGGSAPPLPKKDFAPPPKHPNAINPAPNSTSNSGQSAGQSAANSIGNSASASTSSLFQPRPSAPSTQVDEDVPPPMPKRPSQNRNSRSEPRSESRSEPSSKRRSFLVHNVDRQCSTDIVIHPEFLLIDEQKWNYRDILSYSTEKKHLFIELQNPNASMDLRTDNRDTAEQILSSIASMTGASRGGGGLTEVFVAAKSAGNKSARVSIDFVAANGREVSVKEGELVFILDQSKKEWWLVRNHAGAEGLLPSHILEVEEDKTKSLWPFKKGKKDSREHKSSRDESSRERTRDRDADRARERDRDRDREGPGRQQSIRRSNSKRKPDQRKVRTWTDRGANFRVEAALLGCADGKIHLHKQNGVKIAVPANKLSAADLDYVESVTGISFNEDKPLVDKIDKRSSRESSSRTKASGPSSEAAPSELSPNGFDWFEFFLACSIEPQACQRYAINFSRDRMDEASIPVLTPQILRNLGVKEGDILRVTKKIREKFPTDEDTWVNRDRATKSASPGAEPQANQQAQQAQQQAQQQANQQANQQAQQVALQPQQTAAAQRSLANPVSSQPTGALADLLGFTSLEPQQTQAQQAQAQAQEELAARQRALRAAQEKLADQKHETERKMLEAQRTAQVNHQRQILEQQASLQKQQVELLKHQQEELRKQQEDYIKVQRTGQSIRASLGPFATGVAQQSTGNFGNFGASAAATLGQNTQFVPVQNNAQFTGATGGFGQATGGPFGQQTTGGPFGQQTTGGPFGQQTTGGFGQQTTGGFGQQTTGGPFGQQTTGGPFGQQTTGGPFGQQTTGGPFGQQTTGGPFGQQTTGGPFGRQTTGGPFGQQITGNSQPFGVGNAQPFGQQITGNSQPVGQPVGQPSGQPFGQPFAAFTAFGQAASQPSGQQITGNAQPFGQSQPFGQQITGGGFAQTQPPAQALLGQRTGPFSAGQAPAVDPFKIPQQATGPFAQPLGGQQTGPFGQNYSQPAINQPKSDPFGEIFRQVTGNKTPAQTMSQVNTGNMFQPQTHQAPQSFQQQQQQQQPFQPQTFQTGMVAQAQPFQNQQNFQPFQPVQQAQPFQQQQQRTGFQPQSQFGQQLQNQPLQSQPTGFGFGNQPGGNYNQATAANPFGL